MVYLNNKHKLLLVLILLSFMNIISLSNMLLAKDLGQYGQVFSINEPDPVEEIQAELDIMQENGELESKNQEIAEKTKEKIIRPLSLTHIINTQEPRTFYYEPSVSFDQDLSDHQGKVFYKADTRKNLLDFVSLDYSLYFIDGDNEHQVKLAIKSLKENENNRIILVKGSPIELGKKYNQDIYFDQHGFYTNKLGISQVPAVVTQEGNRLKIEEIKLESKIGDKDDVIS